MRLYTWVKHVLIPCGDKPCGLCDALRFFWGTQIVLMILMVLVRLIEELCLTC